MDGATVQEILSQMQSRGPNGFWAYTRWYVKWSGSCAIQLKIDYTMPKHTSPGKMDAATKQKWDRMLAALAAHERKHGQHGINAANELAQKKCQNGDAIIAKWARQDGVLDQKTRHGQTEGVVFK